MLGTLSVEFEPVPNLWYGWRSEASERCSWSRRQPSLCWFLSFSELTASTSRDTCDSAKMGATKNCASRSSASRKTLPDSATSSASAPSLAAADWIEKK